jgi:starch phosphorylase
VADLFEKYLGFDWSQRMTDAGFWKRIDDIPDHCSGACQSLKSQMLHLVRHAVRQHFRNGGSRRI